MPLVQLVSDIEKEAATLIMEIKYRNGHQTAISLGVGSSLKSRSFDVLHTIHSLTSGPCLRCYFQRQCRAI
jgi:hypothetical protein